MKKTALLSAVLAAVCLASAVGCGDPAAPGKDTPPPPTGSSAITEAVTDAVTEPGYPAPDTSELDFGGAAVRFIAPEWGTYTYYFTDEMDGEAVNDAAFTRLSNVQ
ncbi:MAG: hypothetical protein MJ175_10025, partial [Clostridia bacterium]|nr:hypothetical protein [Clostridia bacterium]